MKANIIMCSVCLICAVLLSACGTDNQRLAGDVHSAVFERQNSKAEDNALKLADLVGKNPEIEHSSVVVTGSTAIIAINLKEDLSDDELVELKTRIKDQTLAADRSISHVAVSSAPELYEKIQGVKTAGDQKEEADLHREFDGNKAFGRISPSY